MSRDAGNVVTAVDVFNVVLTAWLCLSIRPSVSSTRAVAHNTTRRLKCRPFICTTCCQDLTLMITMSANCQRLSPVTSGRRIKSSASQQPSVARASAAAVAAAVAATGCSLVAQKRRDCYDGS